MDEKQLTKFEFALKGIAAKLTKNLEDQKDIVQVGLEEIWTKQKEDGKYNEAYLRQHAKHRMFNYLELGRSMDNGFHEDIKVVSVNANKFIDTEAEKDFLGEIYASELKDLIIKRTTGLTKKVFGFLCEGYTQNEIAQKLNTYQKNISRQKQKIQDIVKNLYGGRLTLQKTRDESYKKGQLWFCFT